MGKLCRTNFRNRKKKDDCPLCSLFPFTITYPQLPSILPAPPPQTRILGCVANSRQAYSIEGEARGCLCSPTPSPTPTPPHPRCKSFTPPPHPAQTHTHRKLIFSQPQLGQQTYCTTLLCYYCHVLKVQYKLTNQDLQ